MSISREDILKKIQSIAKERKVSTLTRSDFCAATGISPWQIYQKFDGWREACKLAGVRTKLSKSFYYR